MEHLYSLLLGLLQGLSEILPISSSGHLLMVKKIAAPMAEWIENGGLELLSKLGILLAVLILFQKTVRGIIAGFFTMIIGLFKGTFKWRKASRYQAMSVHLILASLPLVLVNLIRANAEFGAQFEDSLLFVGFMLLLSAGLLFIGDHSLCHNWTATDMKPSHSIKLGLFQAISFLPGLSRNASTLSMGRNMGFDRMAAFEFTFMMSIPALLLDLVPQFGALRTLGAVGAGPALITFFSAAVAAAGAILLFRWLLKKDRCGIFFLYCLMVGIVALVLHFAL